MIQKSLITPFAFTFSSFSYIYLYRFLTCLDKLYIGVAFFSQLLFFANKNPKPCQKTGENEQEAVVFHHCTYGVKESLRQDGSNRVTD